LANLPQRLQVPDYQKEEEDVLSKIFRVTWWIHGAGTVNRGMDIIKAEEDFDKEDADALLNEDLGKMLLSVTNTFKKDFPNFYKKRVNLRCKGRGSEISNWGILSVRIQPSQSSNRQHGKV